MSEPQNSRFRFLYSDFNLGDMMLPMPPFTHSKQGVYRELWQPDTEGGHEITQAHSCIHFSFSRQSFLRFSG